MSEIGKQVRLAALWVMIITLVAADIILYVVGQIIWGTFWTIILMLVAAYEIYAFYFSKHKTTISNIWKQWAMKSPITAYITLALLWIGLTALAVHLAVW